MANMPGQPVISNNGISLMLEVVGSSQKEAIFKSSNIKLTMTSHSYKESIMELALKTYHCTKCPSYIRRF